MLDPETPDERRDQIASDARQRIESGGSLKAEKAWGLRKLAYEIHQRTEADYRFFRFETESPLLDELNHNLKITDGVLRFRIFKVDPESPVIEPPPPVSLASSRRAATWTRRPSRPRTRARRLRGSRRAPAPSPAPAAPRHPPPPRPRLRPRSRPAPPAPEPPPAEQAPRGRPAGAGRVDAAARAAPPSPRPRPSKAAASAFSRPFPRGRERAAPRLRLESEQANRER